MSAFFKTNKKYILFIAVALMAIGVFILIIIILNKPENTQPPEINIPEAKHPDIIYSNIIFRNSYDGDSMIERMYYNDDFFTISSYEYSDYLARLSLSMSAAAFNSRESDFYWGNSNESDTFGRDNNIKHALKEFNFKGYTPYNYNVSLNDSSSKVAFSIAHKTISDEQQEYVLLAVVIRGGGYGAEWADNFFVGNNGKHHEGFYLASMEVVHEIQSLIDEKGITKPIKIWVTGYSRGGAVANITGAILNELYEPQHIYAYTFASPQTVLLDSKNEDNDLHNNIFNIINPLDVVSIVPLSGWNFDRYGMTLPLSVIDSFHNDDRVINKYYEITGEDYPIVSSSNSIINIESVLFSLSPTVKEWNDKWQNIVSNYLLLLNSKKESVKKDNETGIEHISWEAMSITESFIYQFGTENLLAFNSTIYRIIQNYERDGTTLAYANVFLSLCNMHNVNALTLLNDYNKIITAINFFRAVSLINGENTDFNMSEIRVSHFPELFMAWLYTDNLYFDEVLY